MWTHSDKRVLGNAIILTPRYSSKKLLFFTVYDHCKKNKNFPIADRCHSDPEFKPASLILSNLTNIQLPFSFTSIHTGIWEILCYE